jgi:hypothetical protein
MASQKQPGDGAKKKVLIAILGIVLVLGGVFVAITLTPKPMSSDLSQIGQGTPSVVLAYENFSPTGGEALARLKEVRPDYEPQLNFIVADLGTPQGRAFANRYQLRDGQAVLLGPNGQPIALAELAQSEQALRQQLDRVLGAML